jgi:hypothetical protein
MTTTIGEEALDFSECYDMLVGAVIGARVIGCKMPEDVVVLLLMQGVALRRPKGFFRDRRL